MNNLSKAVLLGTLVFSCFMGVVITQISGDLVDSNYEDCLESSEVTLENCVNTNTKHGAYKPYSDELMQSVAVHNMECVKEDRLQKENCKSLIVAE